MRKRVFLDIQTSVYASITDPTFEMMLCHVREVGALKHSPGNIADIGKLASKKIQRTELFCYSVLSHCGDISANKHNIIINFLERQYIN